MGEDVNETNVEMEIWRLALDKPAHLTIRSIWVLASDLSNHIRKSKQGEGDTNVEMEVGFISLQTQEVNINHSTAVIALVLIVTQVSIFAENKLLLITFFYFCHNMASFS